MFKQYRFAVPLCILIAMLFALAVPAPVVAEDGTPEGPAPEASEVVAADESAAGETLAEVVETLAEAGVTLTDAEGEPIPLASEAAAAILAGDPYIDRGGVTYRFLPIGGCAPYGGVGPTCTESATPIQAAINFANAGETVNIEAGTYTETGITINKAITLSGADPTTVLIKPATGSGIYLRSDNVTIANLTIDTNNTWGIDLDGGSGILPGAVTGGIDHTLIQNVILTGNLEGVFIGNGAVVSDFVIDASTLNGNSLEGVGISGATTQVTDMQITGSTLRSNGNHGIYINGATISGLTISNSTIGQNGNEGLHATGATISHLLVDGSTFTGNGTRGGGFGFLLKNVTGADIVVYDSDFINNTASGLTVAGGNINGLTIQDSFFSGNAWEHMDLGVQWISPNAIINNLQILGNDFGGGPWAGVYVESTTTLNGTPAASNNRMAVDLWDMRSAGTQLNASNNWWLCNLGPGGAGCRNFQGSRTISNSFLMLGLDADPDPIYANAAPNASNLTAFLYVNTDAAQTAVAGVPWFVPVVNLTTAGMGTLVGNVFTSNGTPGTATFQSVLNNATVTTNLEVLYVPPPAEDDGGAGTFFIPVTGAGACENMVVVPVGGSSGNGALDGRCALVFQLMDGTTEMARATLGEYAASRGTNITLDPLGEGEVTGLGDGMQYVGPAFTLGGDGVTAFSQAVELRFFLPAGYAVPDGMKLAVLFQGAGGTGWSQVSSYVDGNAVVAFVTNPGSYVLVLVPA